MMDQAGWCGGWRTHLPDLLLAVQHHQRASVGNLECSQRKHSSGPVPHFSTLLDHGNRKWDKNHTNCPKFGIFSVKGAGILIKPDFIMTFCSVRKLFLAVPNAPCCSAEHRRPDDNLAAKTSKNKNLFFFFLQRNIAASCPPPGPDRHGSSGGGSACMMLIVPFWFSAIFFVRWGIFSGLGSGRGNRVAKVMGCIKMLIVGWSCPERSVWGPSWKPSARVRRWGWRSPLCYLGWWAVLLFCAGLV